MKPTQQVSDINRREVVKHISFRGMGRIIKKSSLTISWYEIRVEIVVQSDSERLCRYSILYESLVCICYNHRVEESNKLWIMGVGRWDVEILFG
jgi:hypothetical protein